MAREKEEFACSPLLFGEICGLSNASPSAALAAIRRVILSSLLTIAAASPFLSFLMSDLIGVAEQWWLARSFFLLLPFVAVMFRNLSPALCLPAPLPPLFPFCGARRSLPPPRSQNYLTKFRRPPRLTRQSLTRPNERESAGRPTDSLAGERPPQSVGVGRPN